MEDSGCRVEERSYNTLLEEGEREREKKKGMFIREGGG